MLYHLTVICASVDLHLITDFQFFLTTVYQNWKLCYVVVKKKLKRSYRYCRTPVFSSRISGIFVRTMFVWLYALFSIIGSGEPSWFSCFRSESFQAFLAHLNIKCSCRAFLIAWCLSICLCVSQHFHSNNFFSETTVP